jgi:hypothetical protein
MKPFIASREFASGFVFMLLFVVFVLVVMAI